jgi:hypothetical protein
MTRSEIDDNGVQRCLDYTWTGYACLEFRIEQLEKSSDEPESIRAQLMAQHGHRFRGSPTRSKYDVSRARERDGEDAEIRALKSYVEAGSSDWSIYYTLGQAYKRRGEYMAASETWLSYPGFQPGSPIDAVSQANYAGVAGAMLYWIGQHEYAAPLLEIAANSRSGSSEAMSAAERLSLIHGDLQAATEWSAARVRRYDSTYGLRDLLQLMHIQGESELAWQIFDQAQATRQDAQMWSGALVGHRIEGATIYDIESWIRAKESRKTALLKPTLNLAPRYLLMAGTMDRMPDEDLVRAVSEAHSGSLPVFLHSKAKIPDENGELIDIESGVVQSGTRRMRKDVLVATPRNGRPLDHTETVENRYTMLAQAMTAFLNEDYVKAFEGFNQTAYFYYLDEYLPYYAFTAAKVDRAQHLPAALAARESKLEEVRPGEGPRDNELGYRFDEDLTYAVLGAFAGNHEEALQFLNDALNNRPYLDERTVYPMYEVVDLATRLYDEFGEDGYRDFALELSRGHTIVLPMYAWAYFIVAKYSPSEQERIEAAASGLKLDPLSQRAKDLPARVTEKAFEVLQAKGAPYLSRPPNAAIVGT